jgi:hypothetical protein
MTLRFCRPVDKPKLSLSLPPPLSLLPPVLLPRSCLPSSLPPVIRLAQCHHSAPVRRSHSPRSADKLRQLRLRYISLETDLSRSNRGMGTRNLLLSCHSGDVSVCV